ncbi:MAG: hypothetical protein ACR2FS_01825 [Phormidesmis sp.]
MAIAPSELHHRTAAWAQQSLNRGNTHKSSPTTDDGGALPKTTVRSPVSSSQNQAITFSELRHRTTQGLRPSDRFQRAMPSHAIDSRSVIAPL